MTKKHFIGLADALRRNVPDPESNAIEDERPFFDNIVRDIADFCQSQNPHFNRERWLGYIAGTNGKNGGTIK
jgi:hypothetical protein